MKRKPKFIWTEEIEIIFYFVIIGIILSGGYYFYVVYRNSYSSYNLPWYANTQKTTGKIIKIEEKKSIVLQRRKESLNIEYKIFFSYSIGNQKFINNQTINTILKNEIWFRKFSQKQLDSTVIVEYSVNNFSQSKIDITDLVK